ncbi:MAG: hypothetical protein QM785_10735 [Pyrinomonadaceae bacterium]
MAEKVSVKYLLVWQSSGGDVAVAAMGAARWEETEVAKLGATEAAVVYKP